MRGLLARIALVLGGVLAALLLAEGALRLVPAGTRLAAEVAPPAIEAPPAPPPAAAAEAPAGRRRRPRRSSVRNGWLYVDDPDPRIVRRLPEGVEILHKGVAIRTNRQGFRGPELRQGTRRIVGIGDSVMFGWGVPEEVCYLRRLEAILAPSHPDLEVVNLAVPAYNTLQEVALLERHLETLSPTCVIVGFTPNDLKDPRPNLGARPLPERHSYLYRLVNSRLKGLLAPRSWREAVENELRRLARIARERGFRVIVLVSADWVTAKSDPAAVPYPGLQALFRELGFEVVNLHTVLVHACRAGEIGDSTDLWLSRTGRVDPHPNVKGHDMIARALAPVIEGGRLP